MNKKLQKAIKHYLIDEDISQKKLADILGIDGKYFSNMMNGYDCVSQIVVNKLNELLDIELTQEEANKEADDA